MADETYGRHAWTLARLIAGLHVNGELGELPPSFQPIGRRLAGLPSGDRPGAWEDFVKDREDRASIIQSIADADPESPAPEASEDGDEAEDDGWGPIRLGTFPPAEPFPIEVLPEAMARLVRDGAEAIGCPPDFIAVPTLAVVGGVIGRSVSLRLKADYFVSSSLFVACVGPPSDGKTPGSELAAKAVRRIDEVLRAEHAAAFADWENEANKPVSKGEKRTRPTNPPKRRRIDIDDITMEAVPIILAENERGAVMIRDELTALMLGMNQFKGGKGNDRPSILKIWSGTAIKKDRVGHEANIPIECHHPCLSIMGGLPPDMLGSMVDPNGRADGFLDRWLFAFPESLAVPGWTRRGVPDETLTDWYELVARLWARPLNVKEGRLVPHVAKFTAEGEVTWIRHYEAHASEMNAPTFPPSLRGPWGKLRDYAGRLALILACADHASDPTLNPTEIPEVGSRLVEDAWRLVAYFKAQTRRVHAVIALGPQAGSHVYKALVSWIRSGERTSFSVHEIKQARRWIGEEDLDEALGALIRQNAIREIPAVANGPKGGRRPSSVYQVNPAMLVTQNP